MKRLFALALALMATAAFGQTKVPVPLLNPIGSTAGQVITSSGPSSAPAWQSLPSSVTGITAGTGITANTSSGNVTVSLSTPVSIANGGTGASSSSAALAALGGAPLASPTFTGTVTIPSGASISGYLTSSAAASTYAPLASPTFTGTVTIPSGASINGYLTTTSAASTYAPLASPALTGAPTAPTASTGTNTTQLASTAFVANTFASPPSGGYGSATPEPVAATTVSATGLITPTSSIGVKGTTAGDSAQAGSVGEYISSSASGVAMTTATANNITSISLTAGDWDVIGVVSFNPAGGAAPSYQEAGTNTTSATFGGIGSYTYLQFAAASGNGSVVVAPTTRYNVSTTTTVYLVGSVTFSSGTVNGAGLIRARRVR